MIHKKIKRTILFFVLLAMMLAALLTGCKPRQNGGNDPTSQTTASTETLPVVEPDSNLFDPSMIPDFNGKDYLIKVNGNKTFFTEDELLTEYTIIISISKFC